MSKLAPLRDAANEPAIERCTKGATLIPAGVRGHFCLTCLLCSADTANVEKFGPRLPWQYPVPRAVQLTGHQNSPKLYLELVTNQQQSSLPRESQDSSLACGHHFQQRSSKPGGHWWLLLNIWIEDFRPRDKPYRKSNASKKEIGEVLWINSESHEGFHAASHCRKWGIISCHYFVPHLPVCMSNRR